MSDNLKVIAFIAVIVVGTAFAAYQFTSAPASASAGAVSGSEASTAAGAPRTATTTLPDKTNNAWEMRPFNLPDLADQTRTLSDWKGKVIMLNFWASWCAPCQYEIPEFVNFQKEYGDRNLQVIGIGLDEKKKLANVARSLSINYPVLVIAPEFGSALMAKWGNDQGIVPYTVVIAADGTLEYIHRGQMGEDAFKEYVLPLLEKS